MRIRRSHLLVVLALLAIESLAHSATITWTNASGGIWSAANNWNPHQVPANTDNVLITVPGTYTVSLDGNFIVASIMLGAGGGASGVQTMVMTNVSSTTNLKGSVRNGA